MKFIVTSDWHIGRNLYGKEDPTTGFHTQGLILLDGIKKLIKYAIKNKIEHIFVIGDIFHKRNPLSIDWLLFNEILNLFRKNNLHLYISPGNHDDLITYTTALNPLCQLNSEYIHFIETFNILPFNGFNIWMYSYVSKRWSNKSFVNLIEETKNNPLMKYDVKKICLCHEMIDGASYNGRTFETYLKPSLLEKTFDLTIAGHVHQYQQIKSNIFYTGILVHQDYGDANTQPGFLEVTVEDKITVKKIDIETRHLYMIQGSAQSVLETLKKCDYVKQVVKLVITDKQAAISAILPEIKSLEIDGTVILVESHPITKKVVRQKLSSGLSNIQQFLEYSKHRELKKEVVSLGKKILEDLQYDS